MAKVDPMDIDSMWAGDEDEDKKYDKPSYTGSRGGGLYKKSLKSLEKERERNKIRKEYPSLTDELADELIEKRKRNKGMLEWSEELQRAVMTEEMKKSRPDLSDEQIQEKVDYEMAGSDFTLDDTPSDDTPSLEELKKQFPDVSEESLKEAMTMNSADWSDKTRKELFESSLRSQHPEWSEEQIMEQVNMEDPEYEAWRNEIRKGAKEDNPEWTDEQVDLYANRKANGGTIPDFAESYDRLIGDKYDNIDVPEMETEVVDLPPEDENEKEIVIDRNEDTINPDATIAGDNGPDFKPEDMTDPEIVENQFEDFPDRVTDEEVADAGNADTETAATEDANKKEEPKEEQKKTMSDEDALKEAQELAQDELLGFKVSGANWEKMSEKQKAEAIKAFKDANKKEDHSTNIDKSETNNYSSYERYPTELKVTEDALGEVNTIAGGIKDAAHKIGQEGTSSGSISNEVARAVPHYDYRSLFR